MDRESIRVGDSHSKMTFTMQRDSEHAEWMRTFPDPLPSTHVLCHNWTRNDRGQPVLTVEPTLRSEPAIATEADELSKLSDGDLATIAAEEGVKLTGKMTKAQVVAAVVAKRGKVET